MSAVIWCGIVAVWVFVLIPTWVRRGDIHWRRGAPAIAQGPGRDASLKTGRRLRVPGRRLVRRSRADQSVEVEAMAEQDAKSSTAERVTAAAAPRVRVAAASASGRLGGAVRASLGTGPKGSGRKRTPLRVRRARRLILLGAFALATLLGAIAAGGMFIVVNLLGDFALIAYVRHLRAVARGQAARAAREKRARAARQAWERASAQERASQIEGWRAPASDPAAEPSGESSAGPYVSDEVPAQVDPTEAEQPALDLTDAPTEELIAAQAS
jgi:hypothetical protein